MPSLIEIAPLSVQTSHLAKYGRMADPKTHSLCPEVFDGEGKESKGLQN